MALGAVVAFLIGAAEVSRRATSRHVRDSNSRRVMLIGQRVLFWLILALIVLFAFAFQLSSLATFLGLVSAGIAVALQNVILAVVGYFLLVGKLRLRVGDRVQISGVTGEVAEIGLVQFQLKELDTPSEQPTGRVVSFSNLFFFVSPATGLFKRNHNSWGVSIESSLRLPDHRPGSSAGPISTALVQDATDPRLSKDGSEDRKLYGHEVDNKAILEGAVAPPEGATQLISELSRYSARK